MLTRFPVALVKKKALSTTDPPPYFTVNTGLLSHIFNLCFALNPVGEFDETKLKIVLSWLKDSV